MQRQQMLWVLALWCYLFVFSFFIEESPRLTMEPLGWHWAAEPYWPSLALAGANARHGDSAEWRARADSAPSPMAGRSGVLLGQTATLERGKTIELDFACRAGERMWVAVRVVGALPPAEGPGRPHAGYPLAMSVRGPALPETWGRRENDSLMLSWVPPKDGNYRVVIANRSKTRVQFQYNGNR